MKLFCEETKSTFGVREHTNNKMPAYVTKADPISITQNGEAAACWVRPNKPDSERVNFQVDGKWLFVDNATLKGQILAGKVTKFRFVTSKEELESLVNPKVETAAEPEAKPEQKTAAAPAKK